MATGGCHNGREEVIFTRLMSGYAGFNSMLYVIVKRSLNLYLWCSTGGCSTHNEAM